jgi:glucan phosphoethanolaminetransferase (alkaline phosphatase superfamily)
MFAISLQSIWVWMLCGVGVAVAGWWALIRRPGADSRQIFAPAVGLVLVLLLMVYFQAIGTGQLPFWF